MARSRALVLRPRAGLVYGLKVCCVALMMAFPLSLLAQDISVLVHSELQAPDQIQFVLTTGECASISELRMHFLSDVDCYSGYLQGYRMATDIPFLVTKNQVFGLSGAGIYHIAQSILHPKQLSEVHALLIRFLDNAHGMRYKQFARFLGTCKDQEINCCIPIACSESAGVCLAQYDMGVQSIGWDVTYS